MRVLEGLEPRKVFSFFEDISAVPRGSRDTEQITEYMVRFAEERNLKHRRDEAGNVVIFKDASFGYENSPAVILQGHIDMVCEKDPDSDHDFHKDGLELFVDGDLVGAKKTTLGADNGIAVAYMMTVLDSDDLNHPPLECVFTVDEEIGMLGAEAMDMSDLKGKYLINVDSEEEGIFTVSCAGGVSAKCYLKMHMTDAKENGIRIDITGLKGGHSGIEIDKGRGSSNEICGRLLYELSKELKLGIATIEGGSKDNAIGKLTVVKGTVDDIDKAKKIAYEFEKQIAHELGERDPDFRIEVEEIKIDDKVSDEDSTKRLVTYLINSPQGVQSMSFDIEGLVESSLNLGALNLKDGEMSAVYSVRSSISSKKDFLVNKLTTLVESLGGRIELEGEYPAWEYKADSHLRKVCVDSFKEMFGKEPVIEAIHAGLECGIFSGKIGPQLDCISIGPDMWDVHTSKERLSISSTERTWKFLKDILERLK